jgi:hypothetical protein
VGFQTSRKINNSILEKRWPRNNTNAKDDPDQTLAFSYNMEMDQLMVANTINNEVDAKDILGLNGKKQNEVQETTYMENTMTDLEEEPEATKLTTPRSEMGSNDVNNTPKEYGYAQFVRCREGQYN